MRIDEEGPKILVKTIEDINEQLSNVSNDTTVDWHYFIPSIHDILFHTLSPISELYALSFVSYMYSRTVPWWLKILIILFMNDIIHVAQRSHLLYVQLLQDSNNYFVHIL